MNAQNFVDTGYKVLSKLFLRNILLQIKKSRAYKFWPNTLKSLNFIQNEVLELTQKWLNTNFSQIV